MKNVIFSAITLVLFSTACKKSTSDSIPIEPKFLGTWVYDHYETNAVIYNEAKKFDDNLPGYRFKSDGTLTVRQNSSFCGTPPIFYENYPGTLKIDQNDSILIETKYWGGTSKWKMFVLPSEPKQLKATFTFVSR